MSIIVAGSLCYDYIMRFPGNFKDHIINDKIKNLSVSFPVESMRRSYGGNAGNIAYGIKMLGGDPIIVSGVGDDGEEYLSYFNSMGIEINNILMDRNKKTAHCFITTDLNNNQITSFYGGDLAFNLGLDYSIDINIAIISPDNSKKMLKRIEGYSTLGAKIAFDPGQQITSFSRNDLRKAIKSSYFVLGNEYEIKLMERVSGWKKEKLVQNTNIVIETMGEKGSCISAFSTLGLKKMKIPAVKVKKVIDPTGAGDAYRAGFFFGYDQDWDIKSCAILGSRMASYAVQYHGTQEYNLK